MGKTTLPPYPTNPKSSQKKVTKCFNDVTWFKYRNHLEFIKFQLEKTGCRIVEEIKGCLRNSNNNPGTSPPLFPPVPSRTSPSPPSISPGWDYDTKITTHKIPLPSPRQPSPPPPPPPSTSPLPPGLHYDTNIVTKMIPG